MTSMMARLLWSHLETVSLSTFDANREALLERVAVQGDSKSIQDKVVLNSSLETGHITQGLDKTKTGNYRISDQSRE